MFEEPGDRAQSTILGQFAEVDDGVPEPLQFIVNPGVRLMLVPSGGFGWTIGDGSVAQRGHHECLLVLGTATEAAADAIIDRAVTAGADLITASGHQLWGYSGTFADPDGHMWMVRAPSGFKCEPRVEPVLELGRRPGHSGPAPQPILKARRFMVLRGEGVRAGEEHGIARQRVGHCCAGFVALLGAARRREFARRVRAPIR